jgi:hypothetical protein
MLFAVTMLASAFLPGFLPLHSQARTSPIASYISRRHAPVVAYIDDKSDYQIEHVRLLDGDWTETENGTSIISLPP